MITSQQKINGWINICKPKGITSFDVIRKLKKLVHPNRIGHAGTLDPMAEGVLPIAVGKATKTIKFMQESLKTYEFEIIWGVETDTHDLEGKIVNESAYFPSQEDILKNLKYFIGTIDQVPHKYSACKVNGQRAYDLARKNQDFSLEAKQIEIDELSLISHSFNKSFFRVHCGKGTYVRSICRDLAYKLNSLGTLSALKRINVGKFNIKDAYSLEYVLQYVEKSSIMDLVQGVSYVLDDIPAYTLSPLEYDKIRHGAFIALEGSCQSKLEWTVLYYNNEAVALGLIENQKLWPKKILED